MLETAFATKPRDWAPLVYCWRGGKRSGALTHVLNEIGWRAVQLEGGYRAYRRHVRAELDRVPSRLALRVICGLTGSGKSRLLAALAAEGAQVLDLEGLAAHRGSLLGDLPGAPQPSQKHFETQLLCAMQKLDPARIIFVESESKRIGTLQVPEVLLAAMRASRCVRVELATPLRIALLREEYAHFLDDTAQLARSARAARRAARPQDHRALECRRGTGRLGHARRRAPRAALRSGVYALHRSQFPAPRRGPRRAPARHRDGGLPRDRRQADRRRRARRCAMRAGDAGGLG